MADQMRLYLRLSAPREPIPFNHANILAGALHKWLGPNDEHDGLSLYSFGWLRGQPKKVVAGRGLLFPQGMEWFISALDGDFLQRNITGIFRDPEIRWGVRVEQVTMAVPPVFAENEAETLFETASPIFCRRDLDDRRAHHFVFSEPETDGFLTENLRFKLERAGLDPTGAAVRFDTAYPRAQTKLISYANKYDYRCSLCPVFVRGTLAQRQFAWTVGIGQGTGIGFGALV